MNPRTVFHMSSGWLQQTLVKDQYTNFVIFDKRIHKLMFQRSSGWGQGRLAGSLRTNSRTSPFLKRNCEKVRTSAPLIQVCSNLWTVSQRKDTRFVTFSVSNLWFRGNKISPINTGILVVFISAPFMKVSSIFSAVSSKRLDLQLHVVGL